MIKPLPHVAAMEPYPVADMVAPAAKRLILLAQNESAFPPSPRVFVAARNALNALHLYPDPDWTDLRAAIAKVHDVDVDRIVCGAGSMELIGALIRCYAGVDDSVLSSQYAYAFFRTATLAAGAHYEAAPERDLTVSVDALLAGVHDKTKIVCVANPGNPTGTHISHGELVRLREGLRDDIVLVIDEAYGEFVDARGEATFDLIPLGNTVVLRTLSKAYGLAGLRIGWGLFPMNLAGDVRKLLNPNNVTAVSQTAGVAAIGDQDYMRYVCRQTHTGRDRFAGQLKQIGLDVSPSYTNFALIKFRDEVSAVRADDALRAKRIIMRRVAGYGLANCLRATIGKIEDMDLAASVLSDWMKSQ